MNKHSKCPLCYSEHLPEWHERGGTQPSKVDWSTPYDEWLIPLLNTYRYGGAIECRAIPSAIQAHMERELIDYALEIIGKDEHTKAKCPANGFTCICPMFLQNYNHLREKLRSKLDKV